MMLSCSSVKPIKKTTEQNENNVSALTHKETKLVDLWVNKKNPECHFLYKKTKNPIKSTPIDIMKCFNLGFYMSMYSHKGENLPKDLQEKLHNHPLDIYLGKRLLKYIKQFSNEDLTILLKYVMYGFAENLSFAKTLVSMGAETNNIFLERVFSKNQSDYCDAALYILKRNINSFKNKPSLYEPISIGRRSSDTQFKEKHFINYYRKDALFRFTYNHSHSPRRCTKVLELLLNEANPHLRDARSSYKGTPLHSFMDNFGSRIPKELAVSLGVKLISKHNINAQDRFGNTPLHYLVHVSANGTTDKVTKMFEVMLKAEANIDIKNNKGLTIRELVMRSEKLVKLREIISK